MDVIQIPVGFLMFGCIITGFLAGILIAIPASVRMTKIWSKYL